MKHFYIRIFSFIAPYWKSLAFTICISLLFATTNVYFIPLVRDIGKEMSRKHELYFSMQMVNASILWILRVITQYTQTYMTQKLSYRVMYDIQETVYAKVHLFSQHFYGKWKLGEIYTRILSDSSRVKDAIVQTFAQLVPQTLTLIAVPIYLFTISPTLTLFTLIAVPIFVITTTYFTELLKRLAEQIQKKSANITHIIQESIINMKLVQAYVMENTSINRLKQNNLKNYKFQMKATRLLETKKAIELLFQGVILISILFIGGKAVTTDNLTGPELLSFFTGCALLIDPIIAISASYTKIQEALVSAKRIYEIIDHPVLITNPKNGIKTPIQGKVELKNCFFSYTKKDGNVLKDISISANPGEVIALVGLSGAGKSTLTNLIPRFFDLNEGSLLIDNQPIKKFDLHFLRSNIGIVLQDDILFSGSILENIKFGTKDAREEDIINAAKVANAWSFIEKFPDKLFTNVGDQGKRLSGGQKQRISIARAILKNPKILILDEATSSLDSESEHLVKNALIKLMKGRTTFVVAHRLSTIKHASKIIVLENGEIIEQGSHEDLIKKDGKYNSLYQLQLR
ncbi:ABC transporter ATP-binding protein [Candidatus Marinamargulisbacteria bacterium SCGC AG-343-D04]|nr:ABC transporter ATP-binding protein [Candidatus Marinamargulisbacteria bacterium SCGC AG-343-D04]